MNFLQLFLPKSFAFTLCNSAWEWSWQGKTSPSCKSPIFTPHSVCFCFCSLIFGVLINHLNIVTTSGVNSKQWGNRSCNAQVIYCETLKICSSLWICEFISFTFNITKRTRAKETGVKIFCKSYWMFFFFSILGYKMISDSDNIKIPYSMKHLVLIDFLSTYSKE